MPGLDLRAEFAKLCADMPAGDADGATYEETLGQAVHRVISGGRGHRAEVSTATPYESDPAAIDCPFMVAVMALSAQSLAPSL